MRLSGGCRPIRWRPRACASARLLPSLAEWRPLEAVAPAATEGGPGRASCLASTLAASLEMARDGALELSQAQVFAPLHLRARPRRVSEPPLPAERMVEALLFAAASPLSRADLARRLPEGVDVEAALALLARAYAGRGVVLQEVAGAFRFVTAPDLSALMVEERHEVKRLSRAANEVLAIVAYHQPVSRAEIESVRGRCAVQGRPGHADGGGLGSHAGPPPHARAAPVVYGTTDAFLEHFGLASLADLPGATDLKAGGPARRPPAPRLRGSGPLPRRRRAARPAGARRARVRAGLRRGVRGAPSALPPPPSGVEPALSLIGT